MIYCALSAGTVIDYALGEFQGKGTGETSLFHQLMDSLTANDVLLADCSFAIVMGLQSKGVHFVSRNHAQKKADFRKGITLGAKDHLIAWVKPKRKPVWMAEADYQLLPRMSTK